MKPYEKIKTIGNVVFYYDGNGEKNMATKERFREIQKELKLGGFLK